MRAAKRSNRKRRGGGGCRAASEACHGESGSVCHDRAAPRRTGFYPQTTQPTALTPQSLTF